LRSGGKGTVSDIEVPPKRSLNAQQIGWFHDQPPNVPLPATADARPVPPSVLI
jgi:hypothetical protein